MDWFEHRRDWREFYRLKSTFGAGTHWHSAMANDPEIAELTAQWERENRGKRKQSAGVSPVGFDLYMHKLTDIQDSIAALIASQGGGDFRPAPRPVFLAQKIKSERSRERARGRAAQLVPHDYKVETTE